MSKSKPSEVDVLIIGPGPSGLAAATWLSTLGIKLRIIDKRGTRTLAGRADGLWPRAIEILDSFGLGNAVRQAGARTEDAVVWGPNGTGGFHRLSRNEVWGWATSFVKPYGIHQGHIESIFMDGLKKGQNPVVVERAVEPIEISIPNVGDTTSDLASSSYPIAVTVKHLSEEEANVWPNLAHIVLPDGQTKDVPCTSFCPSVSDGNYQTVFEKSEMEGKTETIHAKVVLGGDGAHSWVRHQLGIKMEGSASDSKWGVMDVFPITNYPNIRRQGPIVSGKHEPILNIARENGINRFYVPLPADFVEKKAITGSWKPPREVCQMIKAVVQDTIHPYTLDYEYCDWYTVYKVGRRVASAYGDANHRIFLMGDACHTHTPKAGQGMNTSIQDSYNLGWKLAGVLKGQLQPGVLATYESERRPIGKRLVELDELIGKGFGQASDNPQILLDTYAMLRKFADGRAVMYEPCLTLDKGQDGAGYGYGPAKGIKLGMRLHNHYVRAQANSWLAQMMDLLPSNGQWRLIVYGGDVSKKAQLDRVNKLGAALVAAATTTTTTTTTTGDEGVGGLVNRYRSITPDKAWLELLLIHTAHIDSVNIQVFDPAFRPQQGKYRATSWLQVWIDDETTPLPEYNKALGPAHRVLDIDPSVGAMALIRPDTFVAWAGGFEDLPNLEKFCAGMFV